MNIIGKNFKSKAYGIGTCVSQSNDKFHVVFQSKECDFVYNKATFLKFLKAEDLNLQNQIIMEFEAAEAAERERLAKEAEARRKAEEERLARDEEQRKKAAEGGKTKATERSSAFARTYKKIENEVTLERGKTRLFYVFQNATFYQESTNGYIWAPISNARGGSVHHWDRLMDVRNGDIIFHGCDGKIQAISSALGVCYNAVQPNEIAVEGLWDREGRKIDCGYIYIRNPVETSDYLDLIISRCADVQYSPFNRNGTGNQGYLFSLDYMLAQKFAEQTIRLNPDLKNVDFIKQIANYIPEGG